MFLIRLKFCNRTFKAVLGLDQSSASPQSFPRLDLDKARDGFTNYISF